MSDKILRNNRYKFTVRLLSSFLILTVLATSSIDPALATPATIQIANFAEPAQTSYFRILDLSIPESLGRVESVRPVIAAGNEAPAIIHIRDAHGSYEAQRHTKEIIEHISGAYGIKTILLEAASSELDPEQFRFFDDEDLNKKIADYMAQNGDLSGAELFLLDHLDDPSIHAEGVENLEAFAKNLKTFQKVASHRTNVDRYLKNLHGQIEVLGSRYFNKDLKDFLRSWLAWRDERLDLIGFLNVIKRFALSRLEMDIAHAKSQIEYPMLVRFFKAQNLESKIKLDEAQGELDSLRSLVHALDVPAELKAGLDDWKLESGVKGLGARLPRVFLEDLYQALSPHGFEFEYFPELSKVLATLIFQSEIDGIQFFDEIEKAVAAVFKVLIESDQEKSLVDLIQKSILLEKLLKLELVRNEVAVAMYQKDSLSPSFLIKTLAERRDVSPDSIKVSAELDDIFESAIDFYQGAVSRERHFVENAKSVLKKLGRQSAILVSGGFHSEGLEERFAKENFSYIEISPRLSSVEGVEKIYLESMLGTRKTMFDQSQIRELLSLVSKDERLKVAQALYPNNLALQHRAFTRSEIRKLDAIFSQVTDVATLTQRSEIRTAIIDGKEKLIAYVDDLPRFEFPIASDPSKRRHILQNPKRVAAQRVELRRLKQISSFLPKSTSASELAEKAREASALIDDQNRQIEASSRATAIIEEKQAEVISGNLTPQKSELRFNVPLLAQQIPEMVYSILATVSLSAGFGLLVAWHITPRFWPNMLPSGTGRDSDEPSRSELRHKDNELGLTKDQLKKHFWMTKLADKLGIPKKDRIVVLNDKQIIKDRNERQRMIIDADSPVHTPYIVNALILSGRVLIVSESEERVRARVFELSRKTIRGRIWEDHDGDTPLRYIEENKIIKVRNANDIKVRSRMVWSFSFKPRKQLYYAEVIKRSRPPRPHEVSHITLVINERTGELNIVKEVLPGMEDYNNGVAEDEKDDFNRRLENEIKIHHRLLVRENEFIKLLNPNGWQEGFPFSARSGVVGSSENNRPQLWLRFEKPGTKPIRSSDLLLQVAQIIDYAHQAGVVHNDLGLPNIIETDNGPVVLDWALAFSTKENPEQLKKDMNLTDRQFDIIFNRSGVMVKLNDRLPKLSKTIQFPLNATRDLLGIALMALNMTESNQSFIIKSTEFDDQMKRLAVKIINGLLKGDLKIRNPERPMLDFIEWVKVAKVRAEAEKTAGISSETDSTPAESAPPVSDSTKTKKSELRAAVQPVPPVVDINPDRKPIQQFAPRKSPAQVKVNGQPQEDTVEFSEEALELAAKAEENRSELREAASKIVATTVSDNVFDILAVQNSRFFSLVVEPTLNSLTTSTSILPAAVQVTDAGAIIASRIEAAIEALITPDVKIGIPTVTVDGKGALAKALLMSLDQLSRSELRIAFSAPDTEARMHVQKIRNEFVKAITDAVERAQAAGALSRNLRISDMPFVPLAQTTDGAAMAETESQLAALTNVFVAFANWESVRSKAAIQELTIPILRAAGTLAKILKNKSPEEQARLLFPLKSLGFEFDHYTGVVTIMFDRIEALYIEEQGRQAIRQAA